MLCRDFNMENSSMSKRCFEETWPPYGFAVFYKVTYCYLFLIYLSRYLPIVNLKTMLLHKQTKLAFYSCTYELPYLPTPLANTLYTTHFFFFFFFFSRNVASEESVSWRWNYLLVKDVHSCSENNVKSGRLCYDDDDDDDDDVTSGPTPKTTTKVHSSCIECTVWTWGTV